MKNIAFKMGGRVAAMALATSALMCLGAGTALAASPSATQVDATTDSMTFDLDLSGYSDVQMGEVLIQNYGASSSEQYVVPSQNIGELSSTRVKLVGLNAGAAAAKITFKFTYASSNGKYRYDSSVSCYRYPVTVGNAPSSNIAIASQLSNTSKVMLSFPNPGPYYGYEIALTGKNGKTTTIKPSYDTTLHVSDATSINTNTYTSLSLKQIYTVKMRTYQVMGDSAMTKKYSAWSASTVIVPQPKVTGKRYKKSAELKWDKISGANSYTVYASAKKNKGYKKVATIKKTKCTVKKIGGKKLKAGKLYYYYVVANAKVGGKTYKSVVFNAYR